MPQTSSPVARARCVNSTPGAQALTLMYCMYGSRSKVPLFCRQQHFLSLCSVAKLLREH